MNAHKELTDAELDALSAAGFQAMELAQAYRELRDHHVEETTWLHERRERYRALLLAERETRKKYESEARRVARELADMVMWQAQGRLLPEHELGLVARSVEALLEQLA